MRRRASSEIVSRADVDRATFERNFESLEDCFLATWNALDAELLERMESAFDSRPDLARPPARGALGGHGDPGRGRASGQVLRLRGAEGRRSDAGPPEPRHGAPQPCDRHRPRGLRVARSPAADRRRDQRRDLASRPSTASIRARTELPAEVPRFMYVASFHTGDRPPPRRSWIVARARARCWRYRLARVNKGQARK